MAEDHVNALVSAALAEGDSARRRELLAAGLARHGATLLETIFDAVLDSDDGGTAVAVLAEVATIARAWIHGDEEITGGADDAERRVLVSEAMAAMLGDERAATGLLARAEAMLEVPQPDVDAVRELATEARARADDASDELRAQYLLLRVSPGDGRELVRAAHELRGRVTRDEMHAFDVYAAHEFLGAAMQAHRDGDRLEERRGLAMAGDLVRPLMRRRRGGAALDGSELLTIASYLFARDRFAEAVAVAREAPPTTAASLLGARASALLGRADDVIALLEPVMAELRNRCLETPDDDVDSAARTLLTASSTLAWALAARGRPADALRALEEAKSVRLHFRRALRESPTGQRALSLERSLYAVSRGLSPRDDGGPPEDDPIGRQVSARARLQESYRLARRSVAPDALPPPEAEQISAVLEPGEAALVFGASPVATLAFLVCRGGVDVRVVHGWSLARWVSLLMGKEETGWLPTLSGLSGADAGQVLATLIGDVERALGQVVEELTAGVRRLVIIPHAVLHHVPFWLLPTLRDREVLMCPSARHLLASRAIAPSPLSSAVVVTNPTGDLELSSLEAAAVRRHLANVAEIAGSRATERSVRRALSGASLLHFSGHGRFDLVDPESAGLLLATSKGGKVLLPRMRMVASSPDTQWRAAAFGWNVADVPGLGRLSRRVWRGRSDLRLEYGPTHTLWVHGRVAGELWSAGSILVGAPMKDTSFAFLSACESGGGAAGDAEEYGGLLAALLLAGVRTIVCTLWPVTEHLAALAVDLFYEGLARSRGRVRAARLTADVRRRLRTLKRDEAVERLSRLASAANDPVARYRSEALASHMSAGPFRPFANPVCWGAFFAVGGGTIAFVGGDE